MSKPAAHRAASSHKSTHRAQSRFYFLLAATVRIAVLVLIICGQAQALDPLERPAPQEFPAFRKLVEAKVYATRTSSILASMNEARSRAEAGWPRVGKEVLTVEPDSQAARLGLRPGDIVTQIDDIKLWSADAMPRSERQQQFEYFSPVTGETTTVSIEPGKLGLATTAYWRPEFSYLKGDTTNSKWDDAVYVGIVAAATDPDLAETAWSRAIEAGYVANADAAAAGAQIALSQGRVDVASDFAHFATNSDAGQEDVAHPLLLFRVATANYQLYEMLRIVVGTPQLTQIGAEELQSLIALHRRRPAEQRELPPPHVLAESMLREDLLPRLARQKTRVAGTMLPVLRRNETATLDATPGNYQEELLSALEPTPNVDVTFKYTWQPAPGDDGGFVKQFYAILQDGRRDADLPPEAVHENAHLIGWSHAERMAGLRFTSWGSTAFYVDPGIKNGPDVEHEVRLLRVGGQAELFVDGRRLMYIPVDDTASLVWLHLRSIGSKTVIRDFKIDELIEKP